MKSGLPIALAAAIVIGAALEAPLPMDQRAVVAIAAASLFAWMALGRNDSRSARIVVCFAVLAGVADAAWQRSLDVPIASAHTARYACSVLGDERTQDFSSSFSCRLDDGDNVLVQASGAPPPVGARILVRGRLEPFDDARNPGEPSEREIERDRGLRAHIGGAQILARLPERTDPVILMARLRGWALVQLRERLPEPQASLIAGALWGERAALPPDLRDEFQETGTVHVLVTAGLHLGVVAALALWLLQTLRAPRVLACVGTIACAWAYAGLAGAHIPSMRAAVMISVALVARACGRKALSWNVFAIAVIVVALVRPLDVTSASFLLSFSCVGAILVWASPLQAFLESHSALPERVREALAVAVATQLGTWPLTAAIFLQFAPYAILANVLVVPAVGATMLAAGAQLLLWWAPSLAQACANLAGWGATWMLGAVHVIASLPRAKVVTTPAPAWCIAAYDVALVAWPWLWRRGARTLAAALLVVSVALVLWPPRVDDRRLRITVLDVGQADAIVVQTPNGHALLVDAGGQLERGAQVPGASTAERVGERIVVPFLLRAGIHELDAIVLSHPHGDHAGGVAPVLRALRVDELGDSGQRYGGHAYHDALDVAQATSVPIVYPRVGDTWRTSDGVTLTFIGPQLPFISGGTNDINDNSIAFILQYGSFRMLFTGDAGTSAEQRFLDEGIDLRAAVLKVGHHGSAYGTGDAFLQAVRPRYAIISVGRHNLFGHPAPSTVARLERFGARVYRTDRNGAIILTTDGSIVEISQTL